MRKIVKQKEITSQELCNAIVEGMQENNPLPNYRPRLGVSLGFTALGS